MSSRKSITKRFQRPVRRLLEDVISKRSPVDNLKTPTQLNATTEGSSSMLKSYEQVNKDQATSPDPSLTGHGREEEEAAVATLSATSSITIRLSYHSAANVR